MAAPELLIYAPIGDMFPGGISSADFERKLRDIGRPPKLVVRIDSSGGSTAVAATMFARLAGLKKAGTHITVHIDGYALSAASWVAMVGDEVTIAESSMMMLHFPRGGANGTADEMRTAGEALDRITEAMVAGYVAKTGRDRATVDAWLRGETWFTATEAVEAGLADRVEPGQLAAAAHQPIAEVARAWGYQAPARPDPWAALRVPQFGPGPTTKLPGTDAIWANWNRQGAE